MSYKRRFVITAASSTLLLLSQAQALESEPLEQVVVTGTRVAPEEISSSPAGELRLSAPRAEHDWVYQLERNDGP